MIKRHPVLSLLILVLLIGAMVWGVLSVWPSSESILAAVNDSISVNPGSVATVVYRFNKAPSDNYALSVELSEGWRLIGALDAIKIESEKSATLFLNVQVPQQMGAGRYPIHLTARGSHTLLNAQSDVAVKTAHVPRLTSQLKQVQAVQGKTILLDYELTNIGNRPGTFDLALEAPPNWEVDLLQRSPELQPGETITLSVQAIISNETAMERKEVTLKAVGDGQANATVKVYVNPILP